MLKLLLLLLPLLPIASGQDAEACSAGRCPNDPDTGLPKCPENSPILIERLNDLADMAMPEFTIAPIIFDYNDWIKLNCTPMTDIASNNSTLDGMIYRQLPDID